MCVLPWGSGTWTWGLGLAVGKEPTPQRGAWSAGGDATRTPALGHACGRPVLLSPQGGLSGEAI